MKFKRRTTTFRQCPLCGKKFSQENWPKHEAEEEARIDAQARLRRVRDLNKPFGYGETCGEPTRSGGKCGLTLGHSGGHKKK